jgi:hypothetical protein
MTDSNPIRQRVRKAYGQTPLRTPRQTCLICTIVADIVETAQADWHKGRLDDMAQKLIEIRAQITRERA